MEITPSETLYIKNIDDKFKKQPLNNYFIWLFLNMQTPSAPLLPLFITYYPREVLALQIVVC